MAAPSAYPPIADYALISDCHSVALVSRGGSIDWCCMPRFDSGSAFGRLIDRERGGHCVIAPTDEFESSRGYRDGTLVLETDFETASGAVRLTDCMLTPPEPERGPNRSLLRVVDGVRGEVELAVAVAPRFDYGQEAPWVRAYAQGVFGAIGGDDGLLICGDLPLTPDDDGESLRASVRLSAGERARLSIAYRWPERIEADAAAAPAPAALDAALERTAAWWREWCDSLKLPSWSPGRARRSALTLKALSYEPTGAIVAATTTSLPEAPSGTRNWDYRYAWIRDAALTSRSLADLGATGAADAFRRFVERATAGRAGDLRVVYGIGGERRLDERQLPLDGYRGAQPVRIGNAAATQVQLDAFGHLLTQSWRRCERGDPPEEHYWAFLERLVEWVVDHWREPDAGIWEWRGDPKQFVHSKAMCWTAVDRGLRLARATGRTVPDERWSRAREKVKHAIDTEGFDADRGTYVQAFGESQLDAAALRLPVYGLVDWDDERMVGTADAIARELRAEDGLIRRYSVPDGASDDEEGTFLACAFWLAETLARQGRVEQACELFDRAAATANDVGLFAEEHDPHHGGMLGNFPQALTHFAHIEAILALAEVGEHHASAVSQR